MKRILSIGLVACLLATSFTACRDDDGDISIGGKGGKAALKVTPKHHGKNIDECKIYIKYNVQDMPTSYDDSVTCVMENGIPVGTFTGLKKGKYYLYGAGHDPAIAMDVFGGAPYTINEETTLSYTLSVTEGD